MSEPEDNVQQEMRRCEHFTGIQHEECGAGVTYLSVRDSSKPGPYRWPCLTMSNGEAATVCAKRKLPTREEAEAIVAKRIAGIQAFLKEMSEGKTCPHCHGEIRERKQHGRCMYVYPCGHRLGQVATDEDDPTPAPGAGEQEEGTDG